MVAEGIELPEQATSLEALGCDFGQGFLFARPMTSAALADFLTLGAADAEGGDDVAPAASANAA